MKVHHIPGPDAPPTCGRVPNAVANKTTEWDEVTCGWCLKKRPNDTAKLVQALLENEARYVMPDEERERVIREAREALNPHIPLQVTNLFALSWSPCAPEFSCPRCKGNVERTVGLMLTSPWAGSVRCTKCEYRDSVSGYLGRSMIQVEPMPEGAAPVYIGELIPNLGAKLAELESRESKILYVVEALRYGDRTRHSYVVGVYDTLDGAKDAAEAETVYRGGKYTCEVTAHPLNGGTEKV